jgi:hypothetical protein
MFPLYNIILDILYSIVICVDFLGTYMTNLVLFLKPGVTVMIPFRNQVLTPLNLVFFA